MATIVQSKTNSGTGASTYTITLDTAATNGNDILLFSIADTQYHSAACTFNSSSMTTDAETQFGLWRLTRFRVASGGTDATVTLAGNSNWRGIAFEVSGLTSSPLEAAILKTATGEGSASSHSCEYASGSVDRIGFMGVPGGANVTFTGANGATAVNIDTQNGVIYKDALGSAAGSVDFTIGSSQSYDFFGATYLTASSGFTLTADSGSYALSGQSANPLYARIMAGEQGSYTLTGVDALLVKSGSFSFTADAGAYTLVGANALVDVSMNAEAGSYALTGQAATLTYTQLSNFSITADSGTYALTGQVSNLLFGAQLLAGTGAYAVTGRQAGLTWSGAPTSSGYVVRRISISSLKMGI